MAALIRIFSDIHYGDHISTVHALNQLRPLLEGADQIILNGDTVDTRIGPHPEATARDGAEVYAFFKSCGPAITFITGNHDPDISENHFLDLAGGQVFVTHGDIIFDNIVPWSRDAGSIAKLVAKGLAAMPAAERDQLGPRLALFRRVCAAIPQRHQAEPNFLKYIFRLAADTVWPPTRVWDIIRSWRDAPARASAVAVKYRPAAKFILLGHLHHPGIWRTPSGVTVINTGSFSRPFGACVVDLTSGQLVVRRIARRGDSFHPGRTLAEFPL